MHVDRKIELSARPPESVDKIFVRDIFLSVGG